MKKRVRVYKPIQKAQEGAEVQSQQQQVNPEMLMNIAAQSLMEGISPDDLYNGFIKQGVDAEIANQVVSQAVEYINDQQADPGVEPTNIEDDEQMNQVPVDDSASMNNIINDIITEDDSYLYEDSPELEEETEEMKCGGHVSKKSYVNKAMKLAKKQMGGQENSNKVDNTDTARGDRSMIKPNFLEGLKETAMTAELKKQAEMQYDMLMGQNQMPYGMDPMMDPMMAQRGGQQRRMNKQMDRFYRNMSNMMPSSGLQGGSGQFNILNFTGGAPNMQNMQQGMVNPHGISNIDVRRSGILGRPKEYSIDFFQNQHASTVHNGIQRQLPGKETAGSTSATTPTPKATPRKLYREDSAVTPVNQTGTGTGGTGTGQSPTPVVPEVEEAIETNTQTAPSPYPFKSWKDGIFPQATVSNTQTAPSPYPFKSWKDGIFPQATVSNTQTEPTVNSFDPEPWKKATSELFADQFSTYQAKVNQQGQMAKDGAFYDPNKEWKKDRIGNWYRGDSKTPIKDADAIAKLNKWAKDGLIESVEKADGYHEMTSMEAQNAYRDLMSKPQAAMADDELIQNLVLSGAGVGAALTKTPSFQFKPFVKGFLPKGNPQGMNPIGLPGPKMPTSGGAFSAPSGWIGGPKALPYRGYNVHYLQDGGYLPSELLENWRSKITISDNKGNTKQVSQDDAQVWNDARTNSPDISLTDLSFASDKPVTTRPNTQPYPPNNTRNTIPGMGGINPNYSPYAKYPPIFGGRGMGDSRGMSLRDMIYPFNPAVQYAGSWGQQQGAPRDAQGNVYTGAMNNAQLSRINVTKSGLLGRPKRYTMDFNVPGTSGSAQGISTNRPTMYKGSDGKMHTVGDAPQQPTNRTMTDEQYEAQFQDRGGRGKVADFFYNLNKGDRSGLFDKIGAKFEPRDQTLTHDIQGAYQPSTSTSTVTNNSSILGPPDIAFPNEPINMPGAENFDASNYDQNLPAPNIDLSNMPINMPLPEVFPNDVGSLQRRQLQNISQENISRDLQPPSKVRTFAGPSTLMEGVAQGFNQEDLFLPQTGVQVDPYDFSDPYTKHLYDRWQAENIDPSQSPYNWQPSSTDLGAMGVIDLNRRPEEIKAQRALASARNTVNNSSEQTVVRMNQIQNILNGGMGYVQPWKKEALERERDQLMKTGQTSVTKQQSVDQGWKVDPRPGRDSYMVSPQEYARLIKVNPNLASREIGGDAPANPYSTQSDCPPGYKKNSYGVCEQIFTGEKQFGYKAPSSLQGAEMSNPFATAANTNPITGESQSPLGFDASGNQYKNEGLQYEGTDPSSFSVDFKNKNMYDIDFESGVNQFNMFANKGIGFLERFNNKNLKRLYDKTNADELYASQTGYDRSWYDPNSGLIDKMGFTGITQKGGQIPGEETYMSEEQIRQFLADGGEIEFI